MNLIIPVNPLHCISQVQALLRTLKPLFQLTLTMFFTAKKTSNIVRTHTFNLANIVQVTQTFIASQTVFNSPRINRMDVEHPFLLVPLWYISRIPNFDGVRIRHTC
ncbi:hypothetical protein LINPERHAP1_LOCUS3250 [Linum perenne]